MRRGGAKLSNIFNRFYTFFTHFYTFFAIFPNFSTFFDVFKHELARLMRKSALLIEILTLLRINMRVWCYPVLPILPILTYPPRSTISSPSAAACLPQHVLGRGPRTGDPLKILIPPKNPIFYFFLLFAFFFFGLALVTLPDLQPHVLHIFLSFQKFRRRRDLANGRVC